MIYCQDFKYATIVSSQKFTEFFNQIHKKQYIPKLIYITRSNELCNENKFYTKNLISTKTIYSHFYCCYKILTSK